MRMTDERLEQIITAAETGRNGLSRAAALELVDELLATRKDAKRLHKALKSNKCWKCDETREKLEIIERIIKG